MKSTVSRATLTVVLMTVVGSLGLHAFGSMPDHEEDDKLVYAVHVLCGFGFTSIDVHNPNDRTVTLTERGVPFDFGPAPTPPGEPHQQTLKPDWAFLLSCQDIAALGAVGASGAGNLILESRREIDVWAVYTSLVAGGGVGETRIVRVEPTKLKK
jgi:hypothetical protein